MHVSPQVDGYLHVDSTGSNSGLRALALFFNPLDTPTNTTLMLPLYYAGKVPGDRVICTQEMDSREVTGGAGGGVTIVDARYRVQVSVNLKANSPTWVVCSDAKAHGGEGMGVDVGAGAYSE